MVNNPMDAFFRRFDAAKGPQHGADDPAAAPVGGSADLSSDGPMPDLRRFFLTKVQHDAAAAGGGRIGGNYGEGGGERLTKAQQDDLESLLQTYSLDNDIGVGSVPQCGEEANGGDNETVEKDRSGKGPSPEDAEEEGCCGCFSSLTYWERLLGCLVFFVGGYVLEMGSLRRFTWLIEGDPLPFVALWTLGHVVSICGSLFLVGPKQQCKNMFKPVRAPATAAYLACLGLTLAIVIGCIILDRPTGLVLSIVLVMLLFVQCLCILWYTASCIPFLREYLIKKLFGDKYVRENLNQESSVKKKTKGGMFGFFRRKRQDYEEILP